MKFDCWPDGDERGDYEPIQERDARDAAEEFAAKHMNIGDPPYEMTVFVQEHGSDDPPQKYDVTVDWSPHFHATEAD